MLRPCLLLLILPALSFAQTTAELDSLAASGRCDSAWSLFQEGEALYRGRDYGPAEEHFLEARERFGRCGDLRGLAASGSRVGDVCLDTGRYDEGWEAFLAAAGHAREGEAIYWEAFALNALGFIDYLRGQEDRALDYFRDAEAIHIRRGNEHDRVSPRLNVALCLKRLGRYDEALEHLEKTLEICRVESLPGQALKTRVKQAAVLTDGGSYVAAEGVARALLDEPGLSERHRQETIHTLATALVKQEREGEALELMMDWVEERPDALRDRSRIQLEGFISKLLAARGHSAEVLDRYDRLLEDVRSRGWTYLELVTLEARASAYRSRGDREAARADLREAAELWETFRGLPRNPEWREQKARAGRHIFLGLAELLLDEGETEAAFDLLQRYKARTLRERILGPGGGDPMEEAPFATLAQVQDRLGEGQLFLDFYTGEGPILFFAVTKNVLEAVRLGADLELESRVRLLHSLLGQPDSGDADATQAPLLALQADLLGSVEELLESSTEITVCPEGFTNLIPFSLLDAPEGIASRRWMRVPSATLAFGQPARSPASPGEIAAVLGSGESGEGLRFAEVEALSRRYRNLRRIKADELIAGPDPLRRAEILHFSTHVLAEAEDPWNSSLQLFGPDDPQNVSARQVAAWALDARLVVLAGCRSLAGSYTPGEGGLGLGHAFLVAGAPTVLATLWEVDDASAAALMNGFYDALAEGKTVSRALAEAQADVRSRPGWEHPFHWAGYTVLGDGRETFELRRRLGGRRILAGALLAAALLLFVLGRIRPRT